MQNSTASHNSGYTATTTFTPALNEPQILRLKSYPKEQEPVQTTQEKVVTFVQILKFSSHISLELKIELSNWEINYLNDFNNLADEESKFDAAWDLAFLYNDVIFPAIADADSEKVLDFEDEIKALMISLLPPDYDLNLLLKADHSTTEMVQEMTALDEVSMQKSQKLIEGVNTLILEKHNHTEGLKAKLWNYVDGYQQEAAALCSEQEKMVEKIHKVAEEQVEITKKAIAIAEELKIEQAKQNEILIEVEKLALNGVRK